MDDDGRRLTEAYLSYKLTKWAFGSGELKIWKVHHQGTLELLICQQILPCLPLICMQFNLLSVQLYKAFGEIFWVQHLSHDMTKPTKWSVLLAKTQISLGSCPVWGQFLLSAWRNLGSWDTHWAHSEDWSDWADAQADLSLHWGHTHFVSFVMSWLTSAWTWQKKSQSSNFCLWTITELQIFFIWRLQTNTIHKFVISPSINPIVFFLHTPSTHLNYH